MPAEIIFKNPPQLCLLPLLSFLPRSPPLFITVSHLGIVAQLLQHLPDAVPEAPARHGGELAWHGQEVHLADPEDLGVHDGGVPCEGVPAEKDGWFPTRPAVRSFFAVRFGSFQGYLLTQMSTKFPKFTRPVRSQVRSFGRFRVNWTGPLLAVLIYG